MSNISVDYDILNQKQTPAFYASSLATRPAFGFPGRIFIDTDTPSSGIYRDTGSAWVQVADPGAGTTGTLQQVTTNGNTTTNGIVVQGININDGAGTGLYNTGIGTAVLNANTTGTRNTAIGYNSLQANTTGFNNAAVGNSSLALNTTGQGNTSIGYASLFSSTTADNNTAIGSASLNQNTTGANNTAIGSSSLSANTTGSNNTSIGYISLRDNTTGYSNTGVGQGTLLANTTGFNNVALGQAAVSSNTTGAQNIGIGVSALQNNTTAANNIAIGSSAMSSNTTGSGNIAIGTGTLSANTTANSNTAVGYDNLSANTIGAANTSVGNQALKANTTASGNNAFGHQALLSNTTGDSNIAIGNLALKSNITNGGNTAVGTNALLTATADYNTAIGYAALLYNTTGTNNVSVGASGLQNNTTGNQNTAIGRSALQNNTTGANNTAIGYNTLAANTTSNNNTALGFQSLQVSTGAGNTAVGVSTLNENTTGFQNSALGISALQKNTTGNYNTGIGNNALNLNTTGQLNTTIGYNSGSAITTGSNNTIIGAYAGTTTLASNIVLSDGAGNVRLFSDANGLIGINQAVGSTIGGQLDIHTTQTYALVLNGLSTSNAYTAFSNASVGKWRIGNTYNAGANTFDIHNLTTTSNAITITSTNLVGIGTNSPYANLDLGASGANNIILRNTGNIYNLGYIGNASGRIDIGFSNSNSSLSPLPYLSVTSGANVLIGSTTDDTVNKLQVTGSLIINANGTTTTLNSTNLNQFKLRIQDNGTDRGYLGGDATNAWVFGSNAAASIATINNATGVYTPLSDINKKKDFELSTIGLNAILNLKPTLYRMKTENNTEKHLGFIAQEVKEFIPQAYVESGLENNKFIGITQMPILAALVNSIKELNEKLVRNNIN